MTEKEWLGEENQLGMDIWTRKYQNQGESFEEWLTRVTGGNEEMAGYIRRKNFFTAEGSCLTEVFIRKAEK